MCRDNESVFSFLWFLSVYSTDTIEVLSPVSKAFSIALVEIGVPSLKGHFVLWMLHFSSTK